VDARLRDKTLWPMLYESASRENELFCLNVEDLGLVNKRGVVLANGGALVVQVGELRSAGQRTVGRSVVGLPPDPEEQ